MSNNEDRIYYTGDETYSYDEPKQDFKRSGRFATAAILVTGLGLGIAFNPLATLAGPANQVDALSETPAQPKNTSQSITDAAPGAANALLNASANTLPSTTTAPNTYPAPKQITQSTQVPSFGSLSSATPSGAVGTGSRGGEYGDERENDGGERD